MRTAGGGCPAPTQGTSQHEGHRGVLRGIENATEIRDQINALLKRYRDAGLGDPEDRHTATKKPGQWHPLAIERLKEIRQALRALRQGTTVPADALSAEPGSPRSTAFFRNERG